MAPRVIVIGAGPAGLTAAWELLDRAGIRPLVLEASDRVGGIARTELHRGCRMDLGGHRYFSRSRRVMDWWLNVLPLQGAPARDDLVLGRHLELPSTAAVRGIGDADATIRPAPDPQRDDRAMLTRARISRIYFDGRFFDYPLSLDLATLAGLGAGRTARIGASYLRARIRPRREERSLEDFLVHRFGTELYRTFFEDYTEKVWGVPCREIDPSWGAQRVRGLSITRTLADAAGRLLRRDDSVEQAGRESSLITRFLYPKLGSGHLWEETAAQIVEAGGELRHGWRVVGVECRDGRVHRVVAEERRGGARHRIRADWVVSTMPIADLVDALAPGPPRAVREIARALPFRGFIAVGVRLRRLRLVDENAPRTVHGGVPDHWIYIQDRGVRVGRIQIYDNWSPYLVEDPDCVFVGLDYFADPGDPLWERDDAALRALAADELVRLGVARASDVLDGRVVRVRRAYPAYRGEAYARFDEVRGWLDGIGGLAPVGRGGMHRYNNQDHSMLAAMVAAEGIAAGRIDRAALWSVNADGDYHEEGATD